MHTNVLKTIFLCCGMKKQQFLAAFFPRLERTRKDVIQHTQNSKHTFTQHSRLQRPSESIHCTKCSCSNATAKLPVLQKLPSNIPELMRNQCPWLGGLVVILYTIQTRSGHWFQNRRQNQKYFSCMYYPNLKFLFHGPLWLEWQRWTNTSLARKSQDDKTKETLEYVSFCLYHSLLPQD